MNINKTKKKEHIQTDLATEFIQNNVVGNITKEELDN